VRGPLSKSEEPEAALPEIEPIGEPEEEQRLELASPGSGMTIAVPLARECIAELEPANVMDF
jgi:hypothetical protein